MAAEAGPELLQMVNGKAGHTTYTNGKEYGNEYRKKAAQQTK